MNGLLVVTILLIIGPLYVFPLQDDVKEECIQEVGLNKENLRSKVNCYFRCIFERQNVIVNGTINLFYIKGAKPCEDIQNDDPCRLAFLLQRCLKHNLSEEEFSLLAPYYHYPRFD
ncbi:uncharacterized protein LOC117137241 [Drosophila mauritiana]|uniref:Uncharacterized protein LOC117137241 n=1 Tax=Drosophila mauritiana TaxID=7226 RepID=A0A6P8JFP7_DROMA|nr:uncharacterized protein LOC117137241 [Drosophila mauritiana]